MFFQKSKKELSEEEIIRIENMLKDFFTKYNKYFSLNNASIDEKQKAYSDRKNSANEIKKNKLYDLLENPDNYKNNYTERLFYLFHIDFSLNQFLKLDKENKLTFDLIKKRVLKYKTMEEKLYNQLENDQNINIEKKIRIIRTITIFLKNSLLKNKKVFAFDYININSISNKSPYYKSIQKLKKLSSELTEDSRLFEAFIYFDSKIIQNIL